MELTQEAVDQCWVELIRPLRRSWHVRRAMEAAGTTAIVASGTIGVVTMLAMLMHHAITSLSGW